MASPSVRRVGCSFRGRDGPAATLRRWRVKDNELTPYPDLPWNSWKPGASAEKAFVNVNAIHFDREGVLWVIDTGSPKFGGDSLPGGAKAVKIDLKTNRVVRSYPLDSVVLPGSYVDDIRTNGSHAYLTDAGKTPGIIVLDLTTGNQASRLKFFGDHAALADPQAFAAYLAPLRRAEWVVYAKRPFGGPQAVLAYLSRYTHRVAIANSRLIACDRTGVTFRWKDYRAEGRERQKVMTLATGEFIRRFLIHVLPHGFHV
jgi:hypothetical protein